MSNTHQNSVKINNAWIETEKCIAIVKSCEVYTGIIAFGIMI